MSTFMLALINCSISDKNNHYTNDKVVNLFNKTQARYNDDDLFIIKKIREEVLEEQFDYFCKYNNISNNKAEYVKRIIGF